MTTTLSRKRVRKDENKNGPLRKICKMDSKRNKNKICYIFSLPNDILEKIVGFIPYWHLPRLRKTCKRLLSVSDSVLLHEFKVSTFKTSLKNPKGVEYAALLAIKDATWPYISYGFGSIFCGTILPIIWNSNKFNPEPDKIKSFLKHFYTMANDKSGKPNSQFARLLYCITLMRLLKKFKTSRILFSAPLARNYWRFDLELRGPWVGVLSSPKSATEPHERAKLLMMLCEMLIAYSTNRGFKKVWECDSEIFVFGNNASEKKGLSKNPTMVVTFKISAPKKITSLLKSCIEDESVELPLRLPRGEFVVSIDVSCKEAAKWGCCQVHRIEIAPQFDANFEDEPDDYENDETWTRTISSENISVDVNC